MCALRVAAAGDDRVAACHSGPWLFTCFISHLFCKKSFLFDFGGYGPESKTGTTRCFLAISVELPLWAGGSRGPLFRKLVGGCFPLEEHLYQAF